MLPISTQPELKKIFDRVVHHAAEFDRILPEMRFFVLDSREFTSLLNKSVYPTSPVNIWEGKDVISQRNRQDTGQESSIYYEVVQTGRPSYAYLNDTNSLTMQASVMAHVVGHCEFSELNVMHDSNDDRTEYVMYLVRKVERSRHQMGDPVYQAYWNACESIVPLIAPNSQFSLAWSVENESEMSTAREPEEGADSRLSLPYSSTMESLLGNRREEHSASEVVAKRNLRQETLSRKGYKLRAPCQDIFGFLRRYAPASTAERNILEYLYTTHQTHDFVMRTQIMNEGWAMYWEKAIMHELFREGTVKGMIEYAKSVSGVCYPRPFYQRNPYSLGFHMWNHIEQLYRDGKVSLDYVEETDMQRKVTWKKPTGDDPREAMRHLVKTVTDYEFLRRFLTPEVIWETYLNRVPKQHVRQLGLEARDIVKEDQHYVYIEPEPVKEEMLGFFTHFHRPRIYVIDNDFMDGGLLLFHRDDGKPLRQDWINPTLRNLNLIWKAPVSLLSRDTLYSYSTNSYKETKTAVPSFETALERMQSSEKPFRL